MAYAGPLPRFLQDKRAAVAPITAIALIGLVGIGALTFDVSRALALRAELANAADAAALAAATQLDGSAGARARSLSAAQSALAQNDQQTADTTGNITIAASNVIWLSDTTGTVATNDATAKFVQVTLGSQNVTKVFGGIVGSSGVIPVGSRAVAGYTSAICKVPPLMICNPFETATVLTFDGDAHVGKGIILKASGSVGTLMPGNFGLLQVSAGPGANNVEDAMGRINPRAECFGQTVITEPGNKAGIRDGFNTRFDIYGGNLKGKSNDPQYQPALNTITGSLTEANKACNKPSEPASPYQGCAVNSSPSAMSLPRDCCAYSTKPLGTTTNCDGSDSNALGNGNWDRAKYFQVNHSGFSWAGRNTFWDSFGPAPADGERPTRYQVYRWETSVLNNPPAGTFTNQQVNPNGNNPTDHAKPICFANPNSVVQQSPDRRTISAVVINCVDERLKGRTKAEVIAYVDAFLTEPLGGTGNESPVIYGEIIGATTNTSAVGAETRNYWVRLNE